jgi:hypothetical protein
VSKRTSRKVSSKKIRNWTFMVYMAAGDSHKLDTVAVRDLEEMEAGTKGNDNVAVVVQVNRHWPKTAQLYEITSQGTKLLPALPGDTRQLPALTGNTDMADEKTLSAFLESVVSAGEYRATNYCLVLWGHAFGVGFGRDGGDALLLPELRGALRDLKKARSGKPLELLGTNACSMSYLEAAFELKDVVSRMVASQITVPFAGWPYNVILSRIGPNTKDMELARMIVDAYVTQFEDLPGGDRLAMTMLNLKHAKECGRRLEVLATAIHNEISNGFDTDTMAELRDIFMGAAAGDVRPLIDLTTLCEILRGKGTVKMADTIQKAASDLLDLVRPARDPNQIEEDDKEQQLTEDTLIGYKRAHPQLVHLNGIGIYAPFITDQGILDRLELSQQPKDSLDCGWDNYLKLALFSGRSKRERGTWPTLVYDELKRTIPAELMVEIDGIGALQTGDRADVAQIIMSIEAVLNGLDRAIANGKRYIVKAIVGPNETKPDTMKSASASGAAPTPPKTGFGPPWLRLSAQALRDADEPKRSQPVNAAPPYGSGPNGGRFDVVDEAVDRFRTIERALGATERVVLRALTHVRFGLGPYSPNKLATSGANSGFGDTETKPGSGDTETKPGSGDTETKPGSGDVGALRRSGSSIGDLRGDLALVRVADLFKQVGESLITLEAAASAAEAAARAVLVVSPFSTLDPPAAQIATAQEIGQAFRGLEEASSDTRRTLRRVLAHPVYGLGPGEEPLSLDTREDLALFGGLSRRHLKLL